MAMDRHLGVTAEFGYPGQSDAVEADHDAVPAVLDDCIVALARLVDVTRDIAGVHHGLSGAIPMAVDHVHDRLDTLLDR